MKESIEKKLGCSIEEFKIKLDNRFERFKDYETSGSMFPDSLTFEELDFLGEYLDNLVTI